MNLLRNSELQRNLWLEITPQRLVAAPAIIGLIALAISFGNGRAGHNFGLLGVAGIAGFVLSAVIWGAKQAGESLTDEFIAGTWDGQRISRLSAWDLVAGKLFGGAAFAWYVGVCCLIVYVIGASGGRSGLFDIFRMLASLIALALLTQSLSLLWTLLSWRKLRSIASTRRRGFVLLMLLVIGPNLTKLLPVLQDGSGNGRVLIWYDQPWPAANFLLISVLLFAGWALLGACRSMRAELQFRNRPWWWSAFVLFVQVYAGGWIGTGWVSAHPELQAIVSALGNVDVVRALLAVLIALGFAYLFIFSSQKTACD